MSSKKCPSRRSALLPQFAYSLGLCLFLEAASVLAALVHFMGIRLKTLRGLFGDMDGRRWLVYIALTTITTAIIGIPLYFAAKKWFLVGAEVGWLMAALGIAVIFNGVMFHKAKSYAGLKTFDKIPLPHMALVDWPKPSPSCPASADRA